VNNAAADGIEIAEKANAAEIRSSSSVPTTANSSAPEVKDVDRDSIHVVPLAMIPIGTAGMLRARVVKTAQLTSRVELFSDFASGSGLIQPDHLESVFDTSSPTFKRDCEIVSRLCALHSYDVYTLRIELRRLDIKLNNHKHLQLSESKRAELTSYMVAFTRPLMQQVYGDHHTEIQDVSDIIRILRQPDVNKALQNLKILANTLQVGLHEIPSFLEEYGDIFLSLAYYREHLDKSLVMLNRFIPWILEVKDAYHFKNDRPLVKSIDRVISVLNQVIASVTGRFEFFDRQSKTLWDNLNAETFKKTRETITEHHVSVGGVLCGLYLKLELWQNRFSRNPGGPNTRVEFFKSEILPGLQVLSELEAAVRVVRR
jgi:hypothetical protein